MGRRVGRTFGRVSLVHLSFLSPCFFIAPIRRTHCRSCHWQIYSGSTTLDTYCHLHPHLLFHRTRRFGGASMGYTRFTCGRKPSFGGGFGWAELTQVYSLGRRLTLVAWIWWHSCWEARTMHCVALKCEIVHGWRRNVRRMLLVLRASL